MSRYQPLITLALVAALVAMTAALTLRTDPAPNGGGGMADAANPIHWRMVTAWPKGFPGLSTAPARFTKTVSEMSGGRLQIKMHAAGEIVPALGVFDAVSSGTAEMGHAAAYYWKGKLAATPFFTAVPFGMNVQEVNAWIHHGGGLELWRELYEPFNLVPFAGGNTGVQMAGWFRKPVDDVESLRGIKMRIPGLAGDIWSRAGGLAITIAGGELYTAMQTGVIDATEWVGPHNDIAMGLHEVGDYYYYPGWHEPSAVLEVIINRDAWLALPADLRAIVETAIRAMNQDMLDEYTARNGQALQILSERHGVTLRPLPPAVLEHLHTIARQHYAEMSAKDPAFRKVYDSYRNFQATVAPWHRVSEAAVYQTRATTP